MTGLENVLREIDEDLVVAREDHRRITDLVTDLERKRNVVIELIGETDGAKAGISKQATQAPGTSGDQWQD